MTSERGQEHSDPVEYRFRISGAFGSEHIDEGRTEFGIERKTAQKIQYKNIRFVYPRN